MRRNSGVVGPKVVTTASNATGVHDSFDGYNSRLTGTWPRFVSITLNAIDMKQNEAVTVSLSSTGSLDNGTYYWTLENRSSTLISAANFNATNGSFSVTNGSGSFSLTSTLKSTYFETDQTFNIAIRTGSITGPIIHTSEQCIIRGCTITFTAPQPALNEGNTQSFTVGFSGLRLESGSNVQFTIDTTQSNGSTPLIFAATQFSTSHTTSYSNTVNIPNNTALTIYLVPDYANTSSRNFSVRLLKSGQVLKTISLTANNVVGPSNLTVTDSGTLTESANGTNWTITASHSQAANKRFGFRFYVDNSLVSTTSAVANSSGVASSTYTVPYKADLSGTNIRGQVYDNTPDNLYSNLIKQTSTSTIYDSTPFIWVLKTDRVSNTEGVTSTYEYRGQNLAGRTFTWTIQPISSTFDAADVSSLSGTSTGYSNGMGDQGPHSIDIPITFIADLLTEGVESFWIDIRWNDRPNDILPNDSIYSGITPTGLSSSTPIQLTDTSKTPLVGPGFVLSTATLTNTSGEANWSDFAYYQNGVQFRYIGKSGATPFFQLSRIASWDAPQVSYNTTNNSISRYVQIRPGSSQYPAITSWAISRPHFNSAGNKAWFLRSNGVLYEYVPTSNNSKILDLNNYNSLNSVNLNIGYTLSSGVGDVYWTENGTAIWISFTGSDNNIVYYQKYTIYSGQTPFSIYSLNTSPTVTINRPVSNYMLYRWDTSQFQFNHDGSEIYWLSDTDRTKVVAYRLTTPYDIASGATSNSYSGVAVSQELTFAFPPAPGINTGEARIKSFSFDNDDWDKIYLWWATNGYNYGLIQIYSVALPEPRSPVVYGPPFNISQASFKNSATASSGRLVQFGRWNNNPRKVLNIVQQRDSPNSNITFDTYHLSLTSNPVLVQSSSQSGSSDTIAQYTGIFLEASNNISTGGLYYLTHNFNANSVQVGSLQINPSPFTSQGYTSLNVINTQTLYTQYTVYKVGAAWTVWDSVQSTWHLYLYYQATSGNGWRTDRWSSSQFGSWSGNATSIGFHGTSNSISPNIGWVDQNTYIARRENNVLAMYTAVTPWQVRTNTQFAEPTKIWTATSQQFSIIDEFILDQRNKDAIYVLGRDINNSTKIAVIETPKAFTNWTANQPSDSPTIKTLGPLLFTNGNNSSSFNIIFDTSAHAETFETILKSYLDVGTVTQSPTYTSNLVVRASGYGAAIFWNGSTTGKSGFVSRNGNSVSYNSGNSNDISISEFIVSNTGPVSQVNKVGFDIQYFGTNELSYNAASKSLVYKFPGGQALGNTLSTLSCGVIDVTARGAGVQYTADVLGTNDCGYLGSPAADYIGVGFTEDIAQQSGFAPTGSIITLFIADGKMATTATPPAGGLTAVFPLSPTYVFSGGGAVYIGYGSTEQAQKVVAFVSRFYNNSQFILEAKRPNFESATEVSSINFASAQNSEAYVSGTVQSKYTGYGSTYTQAYTRFSLFNPISFISSSSQSVTLYLNSNTSGEQFYSAVINNNVSLLDCTVKSNNSDVGYYITGITNISSPSPYMVVISGAVSTQYLNYESTGYIYGTLGYTAPAVLVESNYPLDYVQYSGGGMSMGGGPATAFLSADFSPWGGGSPGSQSSQSAIQGKTSFKVLFNDGLATFTTQFPVTTQSWYNGPYGYGYGWQANVTGASISGYVPYSGDSRYNSTLGISSLLELVTFSFPYGSLDRITTNGTGSISEVSLRFPTESIAYAFNKYLNDNAFVNFTINAYNSNYNQSHLVYISKTPNYQIVRSGVTVVITDYSSSIYLDQWGGNRSIGQGLLQLN
jgi:hypothetical protein